MAAGLRAFDAFAKPMEGLRTQSAVGGAITLFASCVAALLFVSQVYLYLDVNVTHSLHLAESHPLSIVISNSENPDHVISHAAMHSPDFVMQVLEQDKYRIPFHVHLTFAHLNCHDLDFSHSGASFSNGKFAQLYGRHAFTKRLPTEYEQHLAESGGSDQSGNKQKLASDLPKSKEGCTLHGTIRIPKTGGDFTATVSQSAWSQAQFSMFGFPDVRGKQQHPMFNLTHYIHDIRFGEDDFSPHKPLQGLSASPSLIDRSNTLTGGLFLNSLVVKLVPTRLKKFARRAKHTYQTSVASHIVRPATLSSNEMSTGSILLPGLSLTYDLTPIAVHQTEQRQNIFVFFSSLVSIVGGVFVTVSLLSSCLVNSAAAVAKKRD
uniref:Endoplasmic reticulum vesicle transporter C-terminal domain-containing protein n=1 Tax=Eucampia antarctica TaxID=49252 RepID=A0A7S2W0H3_9STRA|mmetsp:Transcript_17072/g.16504  ORF Transcript_17072/g.16504 Transcript_17072/m.16504 type:complete len:377 (+) Transcript_17072:40-1170(+)